jgi:hypothetical protein
MTVRKTTALISLAPKGKFIWTDTSKWSGLNWIDSSVAKPSEAEVDAEVTRLTNLEAATTYQRDRAPQYPPIGDQLDDLYKQGAFSADMAAKIKKVKDDNPKP